MDFEEQWGRLLCKTLGVTSVMDIEDRACTRLPVLHVVSSLRPFIGQVCGGFYIVSLLKANIPPLQPSPKFLLMIGFRVASAPAKETQLCTLASGTEGKGSVHS